jgi:hypothetical protein
LEMPLFAHEAFAAHASADDRVDRELRDDDPFDPPQECLDRVFSDLSQRLIEEDEGERRRSSAATTLTPSPSRGMDKGQMERKALKHRDGTALHGAK